MFNPQKYNIWIAKAQKIEEERKKLDRAGLLQLEIFTPRIIEASAEDQQVGFLIAFTEMAERLFSRAFELSRYIGDSKESMLKKETKESLKEVVKLLQEGEAMVEDMLESEPKDSHFYSFFWSNDKRYFTALKMAYEELESQISLIIEYIFDKAGDKVIKFPMSELEEKKVKELFEIFKLKVSQKKLEETARQLYKDNDGRRYLLAKDIIKSVLTEKGLLIQFNSEDLDEIKDFMITTSEKYFKKIKIIALGSPREKRPISISMPAILEIENKTYVSSFFSLHNFLDIVYVLYKNYTFLGNIMLLDTPKGIHQMILGNNEMFESLKAHHMYVNISNADRKQAFRFLELVEKTKP